MFTSNIIQMVTRTEQVRRPEAVELRGDRADDATTRKDVATRYEQAGHQAAVLDIGKKARELAVELSNTAAEEPQDEQDADTQRAGAVFGEQERNAAVPKLEPNIFIEKEPRTPLEKHKQALRNQVPLVDDGVFKDPAPGQSTEQTPEQLSAQALGLVSEEGEAPAFVANAQRAETGLDAADTPKPILSQKQSDLTSEEQTEVRELAQRDQQVRAHEQAQKSVGGAYAGSVNLDLERGPDGRSYAIAGDVSIDASPVSGDPEATLHKMETVRRAALAPSDPSGADRHVASHAQSTAAHARAELAAKRYGETQKLGAVAEGEALASVAPESNAPESGVRAVDAQPVQPAPVFQPTTPTADLSPAHLRNFSLVA